MGAGPGEYPWSEEERLGGERFGMESRPRQPIARARVDLKGGGRLDGVGHVVDVRVEAGPVRWRWSGPAALEVEGELRAYIYYVEKGRFEKGRRSVGGHGLRIPFTSRLDLPGGAPGEVEVYVDGLRSEYDYDPVREEFQHAIEVTLAVAKPSAAEPHAQKVAARSPGEAFPPQGERSRDRARPAPQRETAPAGAHASRPPEATPPEPAGTPARARDEGKALVWKAFPPPLTKE